MSDFQTTVRLDSALKESVESLRKVQKTTLNRLMNDALAYYVQHIALQKVNDLQQTLDAVAAYNAKDPDHTQAIARIVASETTGHPDPMEGQVIIQTPQEGDHRGTTETEILGILNA